MYRPEAAILRDRPDSIGLSAFTTPGTVRKIDAPCGLSGNDVLMRHEALVELRLEHPVGEDAFVGHIPVRLGLIARHVDVLRIGWSEVARFLVEAIHAAIVPGVVPVPWHAANIAAAE